MCHEPPSEPGYQPILQVESPSFSNFNALPASTVVLRVAWYAVYTPFNSEVL